MLQLHNIPGEIKWNTEVPASALKGSDIERLLLFDMGRRNPETKEKSFHKYYYMWASKTQQVQSILKAVLDSLSVDVLDSWS